MKSLRWFALPLAALILAGAGCNSPAPAASTTASTSTPPASDTTSAQTTTPPVTTSTTKTWPAPTVLPADQLNGKQVRISTDQGDIVIQLYPQYAPLTVSNFIELINGGFYNGLSFHRLVPGFVLQGGDPLSATLPPNDPSLGTGGPGYTFADELGNDTRWEAIPDAMQKTVTAQGGPQMFWYREGIVAMANSGPNTNGSQFFIMLADNPLPKAYTIFGKVISGMDVVAKLQVGDKMNKVTVEAAQ